MAQAVVLGLIQGITEFLPISSSGHLLIFHKFVGEAEGSLAFDSVLHLATALALLIYFRNDWIELIKNWRTDTRVRLIVIASIPVAVVGLTLEDVIESTLRNSSVVVLMLTVVGFLMWLIDRFGSRQEQIEGLSLEKALLVGLAQVLSLMPGTSRSGITIIAGMWQGLSRKEAARFAFLLGMPITLGAGLIQIPDLNKGLVEPLEMGVAFGVAFISGLVAIRWMLQYLVKASLRVFVVYRFVLALAVLGFLLAR